MNGKVQKHQNFEQELNANKQKITEVLDSGIELKESGHFQAEKIQSKLEEINDLWQDLIKAAEMKGMRLAEVSQQQQYNRGNVDLVLWLSEVESQLLPGDFLKSVQNLQKKHALLEADVGDHQDRIDGIRISSEQFVNAGPDINQKKKDVSKR